MQKCKCIVVVVVVVLVCVDDDDSKFSTATLKKKYCEADFGKISRLIRKILILLCKWLNSYRVFANYSIQLCLDCPILGIISLNDDIITAGLRSISFNLNSRINKPCNMCRIRLVHDEDGSILYCTAL